MLMLAELLLTFVAWNRGWRWWAIAPTLAGLTTAWTLVLACEAFDLDPGLVLSLLYSVDIAITIALLALSVIPPTKHRARAQATPRG